MSGSRHRLSAVVLSAATAVGLVVGPGAVRAHAQSLAELAKKEEARRKALSGSSKVVTNKDLPATTTKTPTGGAAGAGTGAAGGAVPGGASSGARAVPGQPAGMSESAGQAPQPASDEDPKKDEQYWRQRITEARQKLARNEILIAALESRINALLTDFVSRDDPAQKAVIAQDRQKALDELARTRAESERLKKEIADIEEEARKAGVPPGWLR